MSSAATIEALNFIVRSLSNANRYKTNSAIQIRAISFEQSASRKNSGARIKQVQPVNPRQDERANKSQPAAAKIVIRLSARPATYATAALWMGCTTHTSATRDAMTAC